MSNWHQLDLGDGVTAAEPADQLRKTFLSMCTRDDKPQDMALFIRHDSSRSIHCQVTVYFPPAATELAKIVGAVPCPKPLRQGLQILAGNPDALPRLFDT